MNIYESKKVSAERSDHNNQKSKMIINIKLTNQTNFGEQIEL